MSTKIPSQRAVSITKTTTTKLVETVSACKIENSVDTDQTALLEYFHLHCTTFRGSSFRTYFILLQFLFYKSF